MDQQEIHSSLKPSKKFLIRGGIATGILALILIVQTPWFSGLFSSKKSKGIAVSDATVGEIVGKDSNGNGIADWEERLWGLDPTVTTTNGISNKSIIEAKRKTLQSNGENGELNETDKLARELFGFTSALGQENGIDKDELGKLAEKLGEQSLKKDTTPRYTIKNIKTIKTTITSLNNYKKQLDSVINTYKENNDIEIFLYGIEGGDYSNISSLGETTNQYLDISKKMRDMTVPVGVADFHLQILNSFDGFSRAFDKMASIEDNSVVALIGFAEYRELDAKMDIAIAKLVLYLDQYGII